MSHSNARLTFGGRWLLVRRVRDGRTPVAHVASAMGISRRCAYKQLRRFDAEGGAGLAGPVVSPAVVRASDAR